MRLHVCQYMSASTCVLGFVAVATIYHKGVTAMV